MANGLCSHYSLLTIWKTKYGNKTVILASTILCFANTDTHVFIHTYVYVICMLLSHSAFERCINSILCFWHFDAPRILTLARARIAHNNGNKSMRRHFFQTRKVRVDLFHPLFMRMRLFWVYEHKTMSFIRSFCVTCEEYIFVFQHIFVINAMCNSDEVPKYHPLCPIFISGYFCWGWIQLRVICYFLSENYARDNSTNYFKHRRY